MAVLMRFMPKSLPESASHFPAFPRSSVGKIFHRKRTERSEREQTARRGSRPMERHVSSGADWQLVWTWY
jgi:hypothetical protein